jgi:hypothetical protein
LLQRVAAAVDRLAAYSVAQSAAKNDAREGAANCRLARATLRADLDAVSRTARQIAKVIPNVNERFRLPPRGKDLVLLDAGRFFHANAEPLAGEFAERELGAAFFAKLERDVAEFEHAISETRRRREARAAATAAIEATLAEAMDAARELDTILKNKFAEDPASLKAWQRAARVRSPTRGGGASKAESDGTPSSSADEAA